MQQIITDNGFAGWKILYPRDNILISPRACYSGYNFDSIHAKALLEKLESCTWRPERSLEAKNMVKDHLFSPGIYSYKNENLSECLAAQTGLRSGFSVSDHLNILSNTSDFGIVVIRIRIWGLVHKHKIGYRSQFAYPELIFCCEENLYTLQNLWPHSQVLHFNRLIDFATDFIKCKECNVSFALSILHKQWFTDKNYQLPKICVNCGIKRRVEKTKSRLIAKYRITRIDADKENRHESNR